MSERTMTPGLARWTADQLGALGYRQDFRPEPLLVEASHRRFFRVHPRAKQMDQTTFVVMASPPEKENNAQFVKLAAVFARHGIGVPEIVAEAPEAGYFLLSDLGRRHFAEVYGSHEHDAAIAAGIDTLIRIQAIMDPAVPPYEAQRFRDELGIFREWFVEAWLDEDFPNQDLDPIFELLVDNTQAQQQCCVHRDFHCRNLLFAPAGAGGSSAPSVGVVDFQDALMGPVSYDLASLLRDCYFRFSEPEIARWRDYYLQHTPLSLDPETFPRQLDLTAVQRQLKAVGIFARLELRDGKSTHLAHIPPVLTHLGDLAAGYTELAPLGPHLSRWRDTVDLRLRRRDDPAK